MSIPPTGSGPASPSNAEPGLRVLLVDDDADVLEMTAEVLQLSGLDVATAASPSEALEAVETFRPEFALLDISLPEMDGFQLAVELRRRAAARPLRLVSLSGHGRPKDHDRSKAAAFARHLVKPFDIDALLALLASPYPGG